MDVEFIYTRDSGQRVLIQSRVKLRHQCACTGDVHPHATDFFLDSATDLDTNDSVILEGKEVLDVEEEAIDLAYEDIAS